MKSLRIARLILFLSTLTASTALALSPQDDLSTLSKKVARGILTIKNKKVGVLAFPYVDGKTSSGSSIVPERLTTALVGQNKIQIIERRLISKLLQEKYLSQTGIVDSSEVKKIGSILGVDAVVTGTLIDLENDITEVNARLVRVDNGEILSAAAAYVNRTWTDKPVSAAAPSNSQPPSIRSPRAKKDTPPVSIEGEDNSPPRKTLSNTQLSNENFPPSRRKYQYDPEPNHRPGQKQGAASSPYGEGYYEEGPDFGENGSAASFDRKPLPPLKQTPSKPSFIKKITDQFERERF